MPVLARRTITSQDARRLLGSEDSASKIDQINRRCGWNISRGAREIILGLNSPEDDSGEVILFLQNEGEQGHSQLDLFQLRVGAERGTTPVWFGLALFLEQTFVQGIMVDQDLRDESVEYLLEGAVVYRIMVDHPARVTSLGDSTLVISYWPEIIKEKEGELEVFQQARWELSVCYNTSLPPVRALAFADLSNSFFGQPPVEVGARTQRRIRA